MVLVQTMLLNCTDGNLTTWPNRADIGLVLAKPSTEWFQRWEARSIEVRNAFERGSRSMHTQIAASFYRV